MSPEEELRAIERCLVDPSERRPGRTYERVQEVLDELRAMHHGRRPPPNTLREMLAAWAATRPRHAVEFVRPGTPTCVDVETLRARGLHVLRLPRGWALTYGTIGPL